MRTLLLLIALCLPALAHQQPTTLAQLDVQDRHVALTLHVPLSELELAFGHDVTTNPEATIPRWDNAFRLYLTTHIHPHSATGQPWSVEVLETKVQRAEQTQTGVFQEVLAELKLTPPPGASTSNFTLHYDAILHQVVTHRVIVSTRSHTPARIGVIQVNHANGSIPPLEVRLEKTGLWSGFPAMLRLGMEHIREGTDHMLFLLVLLLPAVLTPNTNTLTRLLKIITAFTLGHSVTLLAAASGWIHLPQKPVEILIAVSILVSAIHAIRPLFPGREPHVAAAFGLVHGLAFATVLADLNLSPAPLAVSILGFNLGIELMQLFIVALVAPWLVLISLTPTARGVLTTGAALAAVAALAWIAQRITGQSNLIEQRLQSLTEAAPMGVVVLAAFAITAYLVTNGKQSLTPQTER